MYVTDPQTGLRSTEVSHENKNVFLVSQKSYVHVDSKSVTSVLCSISSNAQRHFSSLMYSNVVLRRVYTWMWMEFGRFEILFYLQGLSWAFMAIV